MNLLPLIMIANRDADIKALERHGFINQGSLNNKPYRVVSILLSIPLSSYNPNIPAILLYYPYKALEGRGLIHLLNPFLRPWGFTNFQGSTLGGPPTL